VQFLDYLSSAVYIMSVWGKDSDMNLTATGQ
jgi:hypothetical protein